MNLKANWSYPNAIRFGAGRISELEDACTSLNIKKPLLVTDRNLAQLPLVADILSLIDEAGLGQGLFFDVDPNPTDINLEKGVTAYKTGNHDGVIALGGGSGIDLGKAVAFMVGQSRPVWDFEDIGDWWSRANPDTIAPIIAIPTTAGTGSEVGRASVITNAQTHVKKIIFHPKILPSIVICDPELTIGMPKAITAGTGMDAFAHCLEAFCSPHYHPMSQGIALEGMRLTKEYLPLAFAEPENIVARGQMMSAAAMGAVAFQKGLGAIHALSHPIGAHYNKHHGTTNAVVMPMVLQFNRPAIETAIARAGAYLGIKGGYDGFYDYVLGLRETLDIPANLTEFGIPDDKLDLLTEQALADPSVGGNPREMNFENTKALYISCF